MTDTRRSLDVEHLELPEHLARRPRLKAIIEEELALLLRQGATLPPAGKPSVGVALRRDGSDRETARQIAAEIMRNLRR